MLNLFQYLNKKTEIVSKDTEINSAKMKQLTKAEEDIMQILWQLKKANVKAIIEEFQEPKPAYNTVSTIVRILENKGFVDYEK